MKKKVVLVMLALQFVLAGTVGCSNNNTQEDVSSTTEVSSDSNTSSGQSQVSGFDFDRAISNISIDGDNIHLPITLNKLGVEYSLLKKGEFEHDYGKTEAYNLVKDNNVIASVSVLQNKKINIEDNPFIEFNIINEYAAIDGIKLGDNIDDVKKNYGEPSKFTMDTRPIILGDSYLYEKREGDNIEFSTDEKGKIRKIYINIKGNLY